MENIAQIHSKLNKMPDAYLSQLVQQKSPFATVATMVLDTRQGMAEKMVVPPTSTVADKVVGQSGIPSVAPQQNNQDPRLMAGVGGMPMTPRNSVDTPMTGVAQLPSKQMMADGGIVGYAEGGEVDENMLQKGFNWVKANPDKAANYAGLGLMFIPGVGLVGRGALLAARSKIGGKAVNMVKNYFTKPKTSGIVKPKTSFPTKTTNLPAVTSGRPSGGGLRYGRLAGAGGLGLLGAGMLLGEGEEKEKPAEPPFEPAKKQEDKGILASLPQGVFRQMQLTGGALSQDASNQGILGKTLGAYGKAAAVQGSDEQTQEYEMDQLGQKGINALAAREYISPSDRARVDKQVQEYAEGTQFMDDVENIFASKDASTLQAMYGGVGKEGIKAAIGSFLMQQKTQSLLGRSGSYDSTGWSMVEK
tara:strand:+ start:510 stop:1763 length:1254 start_codon:yes stop_codon:yes gene_type:complete